MLDILTLCFVFIDIPGSFVEISKIKPLYSRSHFSRHAQRPVAAFLCALCGEMFRRLHHGGHRDHGGEKELGNGQEGSADFERRAAQNPWTVLAPFHLDLYSPSSSPSRDRRLRTASEQYTLAV